MLNFVYSMEKATTTTEFVCSLINGGKLGRRNLLVPWQEGWLLVPTSSNDLQGFQILEAARHAAPRGSRSPNPFLGARLHLLGGLWIEGSSLEQPERFVQNHSQSEIELAGDLCFVLVLE